MNFEKLLEDKKIQIVAKSKFNLALAERDIFSAKRVFDGEDYDWTLTIAYNAALQVGRALMFYLGYRPVGKDKHKIVFEFLYECKFDSDLVDYFDSIRKMRHAAVYDEVGLVSKSVAEEAIQKAEIFVQKIRVFVSENRAT